MKKILLFLFFPALLHAQTVVKISNLPAATIVQNTDLFILNQGTTTKKMQYSVLANVIQDSVTRQLGDSCRELRLISSGFVSGPLLKASGGSGVPYANQGEAPKGAFYYDDNYAYGISNDTTLRANTITNHAIEGHSTNGIGIYGTSENSYAFYGSSTNGGGLYSESNNSIGGHIQSTNRTGLEVGTLNGYSHVKFGTSSGDSVTIQKDGTIHQYKSGVEVMHTDEYGQVTVRDGNVTSTLIIDGMVANDIGIQAQWNTEESYMANTKDTTWVRATDIQSQIIWIKNNKGTNKVIIDSTGIKQYKSGNYTLITDISGNANFAGFVDSKQVYAVGRADSINYTVGGTQNVFYKINTGSIVVRDTSWMFIRGDSVQVKVPGDYEVWVSMAATTSNANDKLRVRLFVNNAVVTPQLGRWMINSLGAGNQQTETCPAWYVRNLPYGAWLSVRIQNQTASRAINISDFGYDIKLRHK